MSTEDANAARRRAALARARATSTTLARTRDELERNATDRREALLNCIRAGITQREIARALGVTDRAIRKALEREGYPQ